MSQLSELKVLLQQQFPTASINADANDLAVGDFAQWDSLGQLNFLMLVEQHYGVRFSPEQIAELNALSKIDAALKSLA